MSPASRSVKHPRGRNQLDRRCDAVFRSPEYRAGVLVAITGASGFVGGVLTRSVLTAGHEVRCLDLSPNPALGDLDLDWRTVDVLDPDTLVGPLHGVEVVYHLAAVISVTGDKTGIVRRVNVDGVRNVAEASLNAGVRRLVHCSSVHAFDLEVVDHLTEDGPRVTDPKRPAYDLSKAAGETELRSVISRGLDAVIVNPTGIFGPHDHSQSRINALLLALFAGRLPALVKGGFDWVDVRDVVAGLVAAGEKGRTGENYLLSGHHRTLGQLSEIAERVSGTPRPKLELPMWMARLTAPFANVVGRRTNDPLLFTTESLHALRFGATVSSARAVTELAYQPRSTEQTVTDLYRWAIETGLVHRRTRGRAQA